MSGTAGGQKTITPEALLERLEAGKPVELIDVRTPAEFRSVHVPFARSEPLRTLDPQAFLARRMHPNEPLYVICHSGGRGRQACEAFAAAGLGDLVVNVEGGTSAWAAAGLPVVRGTRQVLSIDRQVRIVVGSLVLLGVGLGAAVNPWFLALAGFCGAGLVFAGLTDRCGMAVLLAAMPWNQVSDGIAPSSCQVTPSH